MRMTEEVLKTMREECCKLSICTYEDTGCSDCVVNQTFNEIEKALEKQIPKKPKHVHICHGKHKWRTDENGKIDEWAWDYEYHNGVVCEVCGETECIHCNPDYNELKDCEEDYWLCPVCDKKVFSHRKICECGQYLDWSEV